MNQLLIAAAAQISAANFHANLVGEHFMGREFAHTREKGIKPGAPREEGLTRWQTEGPNPGASHAHHPSVDDAARAETLARFEYGFVSAATLAQQFGLGSDSRRGAGLGEQSTAVLSDPIQVSAAARVSQLLQFAHTMEVQAVEAIMTTIQKNPTLSSNEMASAQAAFKQMTSAQAACKAQQRNDCVLM
jgi:hypothetical protein